LKILKDLERENKMTSIRASLIRGGTSKGVFISEEILPKDKRERDLLLLSIMGSPDPSGKQLDGLGGGISSTSKVALIRQSDRTDCDVNYLFGQVSLKEPKIDWNGSCGNLAAAVALYALEEGIVQTHRNGSAQINIWQENLGYKIQANVYSPEDKNNWISIPGVPGKGLAIYLNFMIPSTSLLPHNQPIHKLALPNQKEIDATLICGANPTIFIHACDIGLNGRELPEELDYQKLEPIIKSLCFQAVKIMQIPYTSSMRVAWLASPENYITSDGVKISSADYDICSRISTEGRVHHAHTGTGAVNLAYAAKIPETIPYKFMKERVEATPLRIAHPLGVMCVDAEVIKDSKTHLWIALSSGMMRTGRILMTGDAYYRPSNL
jgi:2-methylaconitate cis-trans-isomerase PrpF